MAELQFASFSYQLELGKHHAIIVSSLRIIKSFQDLKIF